MLVKFLTLLSDVHRMFNLVNTRLSNLELFDPLVNVGDGRNVWVNLRSLAYDQSSVVIVVRQPLYTPLSARRPASSSLKTATTTTTTLLLLLLLRMMMMLMMVVMYHITKMLTITNVIV